MSENFETEMSQIIEQDNSIYPIKIVKELKDIYEKYKDNSNIKENILSEFALINDIITYQNQIGNIWEYYSNSDKDFFLPFKNLPFKEWGVKNIEYYKKRYAVIKSPFPKARYSFAIAVLSRDKDRIDFAKKAFEDWFNLLKISLENIESEKGEKMDNLDLAIISSKIFFKIGFLFISSLSDKINEKYSFFISKLLESKDELVFLRLAEIFFLFKEKLEENKIELSEDIKKMTSIINEKIKLLSQQKLFHFARDYLNLLVKINKDYDSEILFVESYLEEAKNRKQPGVKISFLQDAIKEFQKLLGRYPGKDDDLKQRIEEIKKEIATLSPEVKYSTFEHRIEIKNEEIDKLFEDLNKQGDVFENFIKTPYFIPHKKFIYDETIKEKGGFPLSFCVSHSIESKYGPIARYSSDQEILDYKYRQKFNLSILINSLFLNAVWKKINESLGDELHIKINNFFQGDELKEIKTFLTRSYEFFQKKDYVTSVHLLVPYIEEVIRIIIRKSGNIDNVLKTQKTAFFRKIEFGGLIENEIVKSLIDENLLETIDIFLLREDQSNLRNLLCHGLISEKECNEFNNTYLFYILLKLIYILNEVNNGEKENGTK
jgi:hypothetical protein